MANYSLTTEVVTAQSYALTAEAIETYLETITDTKTIRHISMGKEGVGVWKAVIIHDT